MNKGFWFFCWFKFAPSVQSMEWRLCVIMLCDHGPKPWDGCKIVFFLSTVLCKGEQAEMWMYSLRLIRAVIFVLKWPPATQMFTHEATDNVIKGHGLPSLMCFIGLAVKSDLIVHPQLWNIIKRKIYNVTPIHFRAPQLIIWSGPAEEMTEQLWRG